MTITRVAQPGGTVIDATTGEVIRTPEQVIAPDPNLGMEVTQARAAVERYRDLTAAILDVDDYQSAGGDRRFIKRSGWQKIGRAYSISTEILTRTAERDEDGKIVRADATARASAPDGRFADGDGACSITEDRFAPRAGRAKADHDVQATAVTRAKNRAIADLVGFGAVSAEELDAPDTSVPAEPPHWAKPANAEAVADIADRLVIVLHALGDPDPGNTVMAMGGVIRSHCDGVPNVVGLMAALLADEAERAQRRSEAPSEPADGDSGADPSPTPPEASEAAEGVSDEEEDA